MKRGKKLLSLLLAALMLCPNVVLADDELIEEPLEEEDVIYEEEDDDFDADTTNNTASNKENIVEAEAEQFFGLENDTYDDIEYSNDKVVVDGQEYLLNYRSFGANVDDTDDYEISANQAYYPSSYSLVTNGYDNPVGNQNPYGTCWTFSATTSGASTAIMDGLVSNTTDLSELQLAYFMYHHQTDPLGLTSGDDVYLTYDYSTAFLNEGGNDQLLTYELASGMGYAKESDLAYSNAANLASGSYTASSSLAYQKDYLASKETKWVNIKGHSDTIKKWLMEDGAVAVSYMHNSDYLNISNYSYYCPYDYNSNHAVTIVGWDDNYSRYNFSPYTPSSDGAWLVKNSWGTSWGNNGYFWVSYQDKTLLRNVAVQFVTELKKSDEYIYQYDGGVSTGYYYNTSKIYGANIYTSQRDEYITSAGFYTYDTNVSYTVYIYRGCSAGKPKSGSLVGKVSGTAANAGYHTVDLSKDVKVNAGQRFSIVVKLSKSKKKVKMAVDMTTNFGWVKSVSKASKGQSYISTSGSTWTDAGKSGYNIRAKVYTRKPVDITSISVSSTSRTLSYGCGASINASFTPSVNDETPVYTSDDESIAIIDKDGNIWGVNPGTTTVRVTTKNLSKSVTVKINNPIYQAVLDKTSINMGIGDTYQINATQSDHKDINLGAFKYRSSNTSVATVDTNGLVKCVGYGNATIYVSNAYNSYSVNLAVYSPTVNYETGALPTVDATITPSYNSLKLTITYQPYLYGYEVYRSTSLNGTYKKVATIYNYVTDSYTDKKLTTNKTYYYKVRSYYLRSSGETVYSEFTTVSAKTVPSSPKMKLTSVSGGVKISWSKVSGASGYEVYMLSNGTWKKIKTLSSKSTFYTKTSLTAGNSYTYKVRAYRMVGKKKVYSDFCLEDTQAAGPGKSTLKVTAAANRVMKLSWSVGKSVTGYEVEWYDPTLKKWVVLGVTSATSVQLDGSGVLVKGKKYKFRVRGFKCTGGHKVYGSYSSTISVYAK